MTKRNASERHSGPAYGYQHQKARRQWAGIVATGKTICVRCSKPILPGQPWDLDHSDTDPTHYNGPAHAHCNRAAGARKRNAQYGNPILKTAPNPVATTPQPQSRAWGRV